MQVHLKKNFQYRLRGTIYSIPAPKPGSSKVGSGEGLILREDQSEYLRAQKLANSKRARDERRMMNGALAAGARGDDGGVRVGSWMDPDWVPEMLTVSAGGKGRSMRGKDDMPVVGYGKKNPNERRRRK
jgi:RNA-binding protein NOB1